MKHHDDREIEKELRLLIQRVTDLELLDDARFAADEARIAALEAGNQKFTSYQIVQNGGTTLKQRLVSPASVLAGATGNFTAIGTPANGTETTPATWTSDNPLAVVSIDTSVAGDLQVNVAVDPTATGSFNLTVKDASGATGTLNVPIVAGPPPPPSAFTAYTIVQNS